MTRDLLGQPARSAPADPDDVPRVLVRGAGLWSCPRCPFQREYATEQGALQGAAKHLLEAHKVRLMIEPRSHGGLYGGGR